MPLRVLCMKEKYRYLVLTKYILVQETRTIMHKKGEKEEWFGEHKDARNNISTNKQNSTSKAWKT